MGFRELRKAIPIEEIDYQLVLSHLSEYANPRTKIQRLVKAGKLIPVKKGLYVFGADFRKIPVCKESLANLIYGPSYISYQYALSYYGMIPERVEVVTSATTGKSKHFNTPIGSFSYRHVSLDCFTVGLTSISIDQYHTPLFATPEKALVDQVIAEKGLSRSFNPEEYLYEDLRIDRDAVLDLSIELLSTIYEHCMHARALRVITFIKREQKHA